MASERACLSVSEVIAALGTENDSENECNSSSGLDETTDDSDYEVQLTSMANVDACYKDWVIYTFFEYYVKY